MGNKQSKSNTPIKKISQSTVQAVGSISGKGGHGFVGDISGQVSGPSAGPVDKGYSDYVDNKPNSGSDSSIDTNNDGAALFFIQLLWKNGQFQKINSNFAFTPFHDIGPAGGLGNTGVAFTFAGKDSDGNS